jgi:hypothetical protein
MIGIVWLMAKEVYQKYGYQLLIQGFIYAWDAFAKRKKPK